MITNVVEAFEVEGVFLNLIFFFLLKIKKNVFVLMCYVKKN